MSATTAQLNAEIAARKAADAALQKLIAAFDARVAKLEAAQPKSFSFTTA